MVESTQKQKRYVHYLFRKLGKRPVQMDVVMTITETSSVFDILQNQLDLLRSKDHALDIRRLSIRKKWRLYSCNASNAMVGMGRIAD